VIGEGEFKVTKDGAGKVLELAAAPLETFGLLFGPTELDNVDVQLRTFGTSTGRRFPVSAVGVNGVGGFLLRLNPAKKAIELLKGDEVKKSAPYAWTSGTWTVLRIAIKKSGAGWVIQGKAWEQGKPEPAEWISFEDSEKPTAGRATLWGIPYSTTPIRFDDLQVNKIK